MKRYSKWTISGLVLGLALILVVGAGGYYFHTNRQSQDNSSTDLGLLVEALSDLRHEQPVRVIVYRGVPANAGNLDAHGQKIPDPLPGGKKTVSGESFYDRPFPVTAAQADHLRSIVLADTFDWRPPSSSYAAVKMCGFHGDYLVEFYFPEDRDLLQVILCYGCEDALIISGEMILFTELKRPKSMELRRQLTAITDPPMEDLNREDNTKNQ